METNTLNNLHLKECDNIIMLSDIHFGVRNNSIEWLENICDYFYNFFINPHFSWENDTVDMIVSSRRHPCGNLSDCVRGIRKEALSAERTINYENNYRYL